MPPSSNAWDNSNYEGGWPVDHRAPRFLAQLDAYRRRGVINRRRRRIPFLVIDVAVLFLVVALLGFGWVGAGIAVGVLLLVAVVVRVGRRRRWRKQQRRPPVLR
jgi:Flp pilus assembly protein TadB